MDARRLAQDEEREAAVNINGTDIRLPADDPVGFDLDWRHKAAAAWAAAPSKTKVSEPVRSDSDIRAWRLYLAPGRKSARAAVYCRQVDGWRQQPEMAGLLEAMLLTSATYEEIAAEIGGLDPRAVRLYQSMLFNVRGADGKLVDSLALHARFALDQRAGENVPAPVTWRRAALSGQRTLANVLRPNRPAPGSSDDPTDRLVQQELTRRVLNRQMNTRELLLFRRTQADVERARLEIAKHKSSDTEAWDILRKVMELAAPKMVPVQPPTETQEAALRSMRATAAKIHASPTPPDRGMAGMPRMAGAEHSVTREEPQGSGSTATR